MDRERIGVVSLDAAEESLRTALKSFRALQGRLETKMTKARGILSHLAAAQERARRRLDDIGRELNQAKADAVAAQERADELWCKLDLVPENIIT
jgi:chromosome segregation ATPase